jgi:hypothetical protein
MKEMNCNFYENNKNPPHIPESGTLKHLMLAKRSASVGEPNLCVLWKGEARLEQILTLGVLGWVLERVKMAW